MDTTHMSRKEILWWHRNFKVTKTDGTEITGVIITGYTAHYIKTELFPIMQYLIVDTKTGRLEIPISEIADIDELQHVD